MTIGKRASRRKTTYQITVPVLPSFAFACVSNLDRLLALEGTLHKSCPDFSVFRHMGGVTIIADEQLEPLRYFEAKEARNMRKKQWNCKPLFKCGDTVKIPKGPFGGLSGVVLSDDGKFASVSFGGFEVKISTLLLREDLLEEPQAEAKAA